VKNWKLTKTDRWIFLSCRNCRMWHVTSRADFNFTFGLASNVSKERFLVWSYLLCEFRFKMSSRKLSSCRCLSVGFLTRWMFRIVVLLEDFVSALYYTFNALYIIRISLLLPIVLLGIQILTKFKTLSMQQPSTGTGRLPRSGRLQSHFINSALIAATFCFGIVVCLT